MPSSLHIVKHYMQKILIHTLCHAISVLFSSQQNGKGRLIMKLCIRCGDTGKYLGNGMMMADCELCDDSKALPIAKIDRKSKSYQTAIKEIMSLNPEITRAEAVKIFDKAYEKA